MNLHYRYDSIRDCIAKLTRDDTRKNDWEVLLRQTVQIVAFKQSARDAEERGDIEKSIDYYEKVLVLNEHDRDASGNVIRLRTIQ